MLFSYFVRFKRLAISLIWCIYLISTTASWFQFLSVSKAYAQGSWEHQDIVAIIVDQWVYSAIESDLQRYTTTYIPWQAWDIQSLVIPINTSNFHPKDIQHILENLYFEWNAVNSSTLKGVILFWDIPLPTVAMEDELLQSIYPYVDFEDPMFVYNELNDTFEFTSRAWSLPELWHSTILTNDTAVFNAFFSKLKEYFADPISYAKPKIRYDDFPLLKQSYTSQETDRYLNTLLFADSDEDRHVNSALSRLLNRTYEEGLIDVIQQAQQDNETYQSETFSHESVQWDPTVQGAASEIFAWLSTVLDRLNPEQLEEVLIDSWEYPIPTKLLETQMQDEYQSPAEIFGATYMETLLENIAAWWRYQLEDIDTSIEKMDMMDNVSKAFIRDMNETLQNWLDAVIDHNEYALKYPLPYRFSEREPWTAPLACGWVFLPEPLDAWFFDKVFIWPERESLKNQFRWELLPEWDFMGLIISWWWRPIVWTQIKEEGATAFERKRVENHYFWKNAADIVSYDELSIYRWTYANQTLQQSIRDLEYETYKDQIDDLPWFDMNTMSMGASLGFNSTQTENNRAFNFNRIIQPRLQWTQNDFHLSDKELYDKRKCDDEQAPDEFSSLFWGWASVFNLDADAMQAAPRFPITKVDLTDRDQAWNPTNNREIWGPWYDPAWSVLVPDEIDRESLHITAHKDRSSPIILRDEQKRSRLERTLLKNYVSINDMNIDHCVPRERLDTYDEIDYFEVYESENPRWVDRVWITVQPTLWYPEDWDSDLIPHISDTDADGDLIENFEDDDQDGDRVLNEEDMNMDGDYPINGLDTDTDGDGIPNSEDDDINNNNVPNRDDPDVDQDYQENGIDVDVDADQLSNAVDPDVDGDGTINELDDDVDGDGFLNSDPAEEDIDGDTIIDERDRNCNGWWSCNWASNDPDGDGEENGSPEETDNDGDWQENEEDPDVDGDGIPNASDGDIDGDGLQNAQDTEMDGDGLLNTQDSDIDADGLPNESDPTPNGPEFSAQSSGETIISSEACSWAIADIDGDWILNGDDFDIDNDGFHNSVDTDMDGDGIPNGDDLDMDCDGKPNETDDDIDCDGLPNWWDGDCDGDGIPNGEDTDVDGDGMENGDEWENDIDGDGIADANDTDVDGDGLQNDDSSELDIDGDGQADALDTDVDGDGIVNEQDSDIDGDGIPNTLDPDADGDWVPNQNDDTQWWIPWWEQATEEPQTEDENEDIDLIQLAEQVFFDPEQLVSQREDRGDHACFERWHDYRYQIIDSVVHHRNPDSQEVDLDSSIQTFERPIDDNPYVTFHGIWWDQVTMIYPDLYAIPIYECNLMDPEDIKDTILEYLRQKVQLYNWYLDRELTNAPSHYATHPAAFDFLETVDTTATPNRDYELIDEDFFVDLIWETNIRRIAHQLHYLSTWRTQRPEAQTIWEFITLSREQFDFNRRMQYIQQEYLTVDEDEFDFDPIVYPNHIEQWFAYEQWFINSDWSDYIGLEDIVGWAPDREPLQTPVNVWDQVTPPGAVLASQQGRIQDAKCWIPTWEPVPLLKRPKAMQCWFTETLRDPINFSVEIEIDYQDSFLWEVYQWTVSEWFNKAVDTIDTTQENFWWEADQVKNWIYGFIPGVVAQSSFDSIDENTLLRQQYEVWTQDYNTFRILSNNIFTSLTTQEAITIDNSWFELWIGLTQGEDEPLTITLSQSENTWICAISQWVNLCSSGVTRSYTLSALQQIDLDFQFTDQNIWKAEIIIQVCAWTICARHEQNIYRWPWLLEEILFSIPNNIVAANVEFPLIIKWLDGNWNTIPRSPVPYRVELVNWSFSQNPTDTTRDLISFEDSLYAITPQWVEPIQIQVLPARVEDDTLPVWSLEVLVENIELDVLFDWWRTQWIYTLPEREGAFMVVRDDWSVAYNEDQLPDIRLEWVLNDWTLWDSQFPISIVNSNTSLWSLWTVNWSVFTRRDVVIDRSVPVQFLPTGRTWKWIFTFVWWSLDQEISIEYEILHGDLDDMRIDLNTQWAIIGDDVWWTIALTDSRWNPFSSETTVYLEPTWWFWWTPEAVIVSWWVALFTWQVEAWWEWGCGGSCSWGAPSTADRATANTSSDSDQSWQEWDSNTGESQENDTDQESTEDENGEDIDSESSNEWTEGESNWASWWEEWEWAVCEPVLPLWISPSNLNTVSSEPQEWVVTTTTEYEIPETLWPSDSEEDLNIMYLHLWWSPWGNEQNTVNYLKNTKTLAVTTTLRSAWTSNPIIRDAARFSVDGRSTPLWTFPQSMKQLHPRGWDIIVDLGFQWGIWKYRFGSFASFDFLEQSGEYSDQPNKMVYDGSGEFENWRLTFEDRVLVDFVRGSIEDGITVTMLPWATDTRQITDQEGSYGTFWIYRGVLENLEESISLESDTYTLRKEWDDIILHTVIPEREYGEPSFEWREKSNEPQSHVGWRDSYSAISEFAQWQMMGQATLDYASPHHLNIWDPFLTRISSSRKVLHTDYDEWFGQKVYSDTRAIQDTDLWDIDGDWLVDMIVTSSNGTIKLLYNEWWSHPYSDWWPLIALADGIKETRVWDTDGDGLDDIIVRTLADTMRVYRNTAGRIDVNWLPVCLDIPYGEYNVAQANQMFVEDMDGNWTVDIITYDTEWDIKVFYGWWDSYLSTDPLRCDPNRQGRQNMQLIKSFGTILESVPIRDETLRHWEGLEVTLIPEHSQEYEWSVWWDAWESPDMSDWSRDEIEAYTTLVMEEAIGDARSVADPELLYSQIDDMLDHVIEVPSAMRPYADRNLQNYGAIRAIDPYPDTPRIDVEKTYIDLDGGALLKWDIVRVSVAIIPVWHNWPATIWDRIPWSWIVYKTDFNEISSFKQWGLPAWYEVDRNVWNWYEYRIDLPSLGSRTVYTYELQYDGDGYMRLELETSVDNLFVWSTITQNTNQVFAQWWRQYRLRAYPEDGCYNEFYEFSPGESRIDRTSFLEEESARYDAFVEEQRDGAEDIATQPTNISPIEDLFGVPSDFVNLPKDQRERIKLWALLTGIAGWWGWGIEIDASSYLESRWEKQRINLQKRFKEDILDIDKVNPLKRLGIWTDHTLAKAACGWGSFGTKTCGWGRPIPFNNDLLSPWSFHIMGCKPPGWGTNPFFPDFAWVPIFAVPSTWVPPIWPPMPSNAWWIFSPGDPTKSTVSVFRTYLTRTTSNGVWMSLCFWGYDQLWFALPTPLGDVAWNCLVFASRLGPRCSGENPDGREATTMPYTTANEVEGSQTLEEWHRDLHEIGVCDDRARAMSPLSSPVLGWRVATHGSISSVNYRKAQAEQDYLLWGNEIELSIEWWSVKWIVQCMVRKRVENQSAYIANNALHMQMTLILPNIDTLRENFEDVTVLADREQLQLWRQSHELANKESWQSWETWQNTWWWDENKRFGPSRVFDDITSSNWINPFDRIAQFFNDVPLVNFEEKTVPIEIPFIYLDDMQRYGFSLESWLLRNQKTIDDRWELVDNVSADIDTIANVQAWTWDEAVASQEAFKDFANRNEAIAEMKATYSTVERNLETLKKYKKLPKDLYQLLHASDQYISETIGFVESLLWYITGWLQDNATRFSMRVDVIITLKWIIETRQILIDFSVQRQSKCAKCRQDNYDFYSCKLKLLCVDLPILPIPPFHLPDIIIDLSQINLWIDITLPRFNFVPRKIVLPRLPDLPSPIDANVDIRVPDIPVLPPPPLLPQLPTFQLKADLELPSLPPPPKIPKISPAIEAVINIADLIWSFMCIFKWWIGLVSEKNIKPRVEQLTQRSNDIQPFDSLEIKIPQTPVEAYDYKIDAVVDFKADFRQLYDIVDDISLEWSMFLDKQTQEIKQKVFSQEIQNSALGQALLNGDTWWLWDGINIDIDLQWNTLSPDDLSTLLASKRSLPHVWWDTAYVKQHLLAGLQKIQDDTRLSYIHDAATSVQRMLTTERMVTPNIQWISDSFDGATTWLEIIHQEVKQQKELLQEYDSFIDSIGIYSLVDSPQEREFDVSLPLYITDTDTKRLFDTQDSPLQTYLSMNDEILQGYESALDENTHDDLNMSSVQHRYISQNVSQLRTGIAQRLWKWKLLAQQRTLDGDQPSPPQPRISRESPSTLIDMTQFIKWFFVLWDDGKYRNVVRWEEQAQKRHENQQFQTRDVNNDSYQDIVFWTNNQILIKYWNQNNGYIRKPWQVWAWIVLGPFDSPASIAAGTLDQGWWYEKRKIRDVLSTYDSFQRQWQNYSSTSWTRDNDPLREWYLVEVTERLWTSQSRTRWSARLSDPWRTRYVLLLPQDRHLMLTDTMYLRDRDQEYRINQLIDQWRIIDVMEYDGSSRDAMAVLANQVERWYYGRHTTLRRNRIQLNESLSYDRYEKISPWWQTHVVGAQIRWDDEPPQPTVSLVRDITGETVSQGFSLQWNINTTYTLEVQREDNGVVLHNRIIVDDEVVVFESWESIQIPGIDYNHEREDRLKLVAVDQAWNVVEQEISLQIAIPDLSLEDVEYGDDSARVITELSTTIDRGQVKFQRNRHGYREALDPNEFSVQPLNPVVVWEMYDMSDGLDDEALWNEDGDNEQNSDNANNEQDTQNTEDEQGQESEDQSEDSWDEDTEEDNSNQDANILPSTMNLSCSGGSPQAQLEDEQWNSFGVVLEPDTGNIIQAPVWWTGYEVVLLWSAPSLWVFDGWRCAREVGMQSCIAYISEYGEVLVEEPYRHWIQWTVELDQEVMMARMQLTEYGNILVDFTFVYLPL